jgi:osmotically inducible protein OsmC
MLSDAPYSFVTRFENGKGTNPEELIAAAHAGCFTMALSAQLGTMNFTPQNLRTSAKVTLEKLDAGWTISKIHLDVSGRVPGISASAFESAAASAKANCPVSRLLKAEITMDAHLEQAA